jgi:hypothetical protein
MITGAFLYCSSKLRVINPVRIFENVATVHTDIGMEPEIPNLIVTMSLVSGIAIDNAMSMSIRFSFLLVLYGSSI